jgi:hypothetical protein
MKRQLHTEQSRRGLGEGAAFGCLALAGAVTIIWAVSAIRDLAANRERIEASFAKPVPSYATTTSSNGILKASNRTRCHGTQPVILQDRTAPTL